MSDKDPYQPLAQRLAFSDVLNRLILLRPRQRIVQLIKGQRVLDVACGTGNLTALLAAGGCDAVGVDSSPTMLSHAQRKRIAAEFQLVDATRLPFGREFDAAVISIALHEMPPPVREQVWASMRRAVRLKGRLIAVDFAVPPRPSLLTRFAQSFAERDERAFLSIHPEHYKNYKDFMRRGGLHAWIREQGESVEAEYPFWGGTLAIVVCRRSEKNP